MKRLKSASILMMAVGGQRWGALTWKLGLWSSSALMGAIMLAFGQAQAACVVDTAGDPDTVTCLTDDAVGVDLVGTDPVEVTVGPGDPNAIDPGPVLTITGNAANGEAFAISTGGTDTIDFTIITSDNGNPASAVEINGNTGADAIALTTDDGDVTFLSDANSTINGNANGLSITKKGIDNTTIEVDSSSNISTTGGGAAIAIAGPSIPGSIVDVTINSRGTLTSEGDGARIGVDRGRVVATFSGQIDAGAGAGADGVEIRNRDFSIDITMDEGGDIVGAGGHGLNLGADSVKIIAIVNSNFSNIGGDGLHLVSIDTGGTISATLNGNLSNIGGHGIYTENDTNDVTATINGQIGTLAAAVGGDGVHTSNQRNGSVSVTLGKNGDIFARGDGIRIEQSLFDNGTDGTINVDLAGGVTKVNSLVNAEQGVDIRADDSKITFITRSGGFINNLDSSAGAHGIQITANNDAGEIIDLDLGETITTAGGDGINIDTVSGVINLTTLGFDGTANTGETGGAITANEDGIEAKSDNANVIMAIGTNITAGESAVHILHGNLVNLTFGDANNTGVVITGAGTVANAVVDVDDTSATSNITNYATIRSTAATLAGQADDIAIDVDNNTPNDNWIIDNYNTIIGVIDGSAQNDTINNFSENSWIVAGTNVVNDFKGGDDNIENYGRIVTAVSADVAEDVTFSGVEEFNNGFPTVVGLGSNYGLLTMIDQTTGQAFVRDQTFTEGSDHVFAGGPDSKFGIDAFLGADSDTADFLEIRGDNTGATALIVNDINPGAGSFNPDGILFAHVTGESPEGAFFLPGGPIDKGFFTYDILRVETNSVDWLLVSAPNDRAQELAALITGAQTLWYESSGVWLDRTADLRRQLGTCSPADRAQHMSANVGNNTQVTATADVAPECYYQRYGLWFRGFGGQYDRKDGVEYDQHIWGAEGGVDVVIGNDPSESTFVLGILAGYIGSNHDFDETNDEAKYKGGSVGAYATWLSGGFFADLLVKANFLNVDYDTSFNGNDSDGNTDATSWGARLDTGYRFNIEEGLFVEPQGTIGYVSTDLDDFNMLGTDIDPDTGDSLRGRLGLRVGTSWDSGNMIFEPFLTGSVWHEFEGDNEVELTSGASTTVDDEIKGTWGEVGGGLNVFNSDNNISFFAKVDAQVGGDIDSWSGKVGGRLAW